MNLTGKKGLVLGVANRHSLAWASAKRLHSAGADLAMTYLNDKAKPFVDPLAREVGAEIFEPCNVSDEGSLEAVFEKIATRRPVVLVD